MSKEETHRGNVGTAPGHPSKKCRRTPQSSPSRDRDQLEPAPHTGAFGRIVADVPTVAEEPDLPYRLRTRHPARSKLREQGARHPCTHPTNVSTGSVPLSATRRAPQNPTLATSAAETMQRASEAEAAAAAEAENAAEAKRQYRGGRQTPHRRTQVTAPKPPDGHTQAVADPNAPYLSLAASPEAAERAAREDAVEDTPPPSSSAQTLIALTVPLDRTHDVIAL